MLHFVVFAFLLSVGVTTAQQEQKNVTCPEPMLLFNSSFVELLWIAPNISDQNSYQSYCSLFVNAPDVAQCIVFVNKTQLVGIQHIITHDIFQKLPSEEQRMWHSLQFSLKNGLLLVNQTGIQVANQTLQQQAGQGNATQGGQQQGNATQGGGGGGQTQAMEQYLVKFANSYAKMFNIFGNNTVPGTSSSSQTQEYQVQQQDGQQVNQTQQQVNQTGGGGDLSQYLGIIPFGLPQLQFSVLKENQVDPKIGQLFESSQSTIDLGTLLQGVQGLQQPVDKWEQDNQVPVMNMVLKNVIQPQFGGNQTQQTNQTQGGQ